MLSLDEPTSEQDEHALINQAQKGDRQAFKQLYELYVKRIYGLTFRLVNDIGAAEDVTQEIFVKVWHTLPNFKGESRFYTWLHRLASNTAVDYLRKHRSWLQLVFEKDSGEEVGSREDKDSLSRDLETLIRKLPERARIVFVLHIVEGYRHEEISQLTGMAVGSSKAQLNRAKKMLKEWLGHE